MIPGATQAQKIATGFHRNSMQALGNNPRKEESRVKGIVDRLDTTGRVWLGLTLACAECHDHKYDPVSTQEYYRIFAIFNNVPHYGEAFQIHGPRIEVLPEWEQDEWDRYETVIARARHALKGIEKEQPDAKDLLRRVEEARQAQAEVKSRAVTAQVMDELPEPRTAFIHVRGNFENRGEPVTPGTPSFLPRIPAGQPVNRLTFAKWLVDGRNPLPARVTVNRFWAHYFGRGLVATTDDFGVRGAAPSHPQLLDWLAVELVKSGWDMKALHRLIVTSATYRQASRLRPELSRRDPSNRLLARGPRLRLPAEQVRDNALAVSGLLAPRMGGPSVFPLQPTGVGEFRDSTAGKWETSEGEDRYRRSLYTFWQRMSPYPSLTIFDAPSRERSCVRRLPTNTPLQALALLNDPAYFGMAEALARRITAQFAGAESRLKYAFELVLTRVPETEETARFLEFERKQRANGASGDLEVWTSVAQVLLNLDETITKE